MTWAARDMAKVVSGRMRSVDEVKAIIVSYMERVAWHKSDNQVDGRCL